jgi:hypothetical protein
MMTHDGHDSIVCTSDSRDITTVNSTSTPRAARASVSPHNTTTSDAQHHHELRTLCVEPTVGGGRSTPRKLATPLVSTFGSFIFFCSYLSRKLPNTHVLLERVHEKEPHPQLRHHTVKDATELRLCYLKGRAKHKKNDHFVVAILVSHM